MSSKFAAIELETLQKRASSNPAPEKDREFRCPECNARCTRLLDGQSEAGHARTCSRRLERTGSYRVGPTVAGETEAGQ